MYAYEWELLATTAAMILALTGGDWMVMTAAIIGSSGLAGFATALIGLRRYRQEAFQQRVNSAAQVRTVAAEEAESAMRVMGRSLERVEGELRDERAHRVATDTQLAETRRELAECKRKCDDCLAQVRQLKRGGSGR